MDEKTYITVAEAVEGIGLVAQEVNHWKEAFKHLRDEYPDSSTYKELAERYGLYAAALNIALETIRAQEEPTRLLTVDELKAWRSWKQGQIWMEISPIGALMPGFTEGETVNGETRFWFAAYCGAETWQGLKYYGATWRCWAGKPTQEEQDNHPWRSIADVERK